METYDEDKIGRLISWTGENLVYRYGENEVIKFSRLGRIFRRAFKERPDWDISVARQFFADVMVPVRVATLNDGSRKALIQPFVSGRVLSKKDLADPGILKGFQGVMGRHTNMTEAGFCPLDLAGGFGFLSGTLSNLYLLDDGSVKVIDTLLIDLRGTGIWQYALAPLANLAIRRQEAIIRTYDRTK